MRNPSRAACVLAGRAGVKATRPAFSTPTGTVTITAAAVRVPHPVSMRTSCPDQSIA